MNKTEIAAVFDEIWLTIRESNLTSGQAAGESSGRAVSEARRALALAEEAGDYELQVEAWRMLAYTLNANEQYPESIQFYEKTIPGLEKLGRLDTAARTRIGWIGALQMVGRYAEAVDIGLVADEWFKSSGDRAGHARLCVNLAGVFYRLDRKQECLEYNLEAAKIFRELGDEKSLAQSYLNLGNILSLLDRFEESDRNFERALRLSEALGLPDLKTQAQYNRAYLNFLRGRYSDALSEFSKLKMQYAESGSLRHSGLCDLDEAEIYLELKLSVDAGRLAERAAQTFESLQMRHEQAKALAFAGVAHAQNSRYNEALTTFKLSREKFEQENNQYWMSLLDFYRAEVFFEMHRYWEARSYATAAERGFEALGIYSKVAVTLILLARIALVVAKRSEAVQHARAALKIAEDFKLPLLFFPAYAINAQVSEEVRLPEEALRFYRMAADEIEARRQHLHHDDLRVTYFRGKQQVYESLVRLTLEAQSTPETLTQAYTWCERAKSRGLIDLLSHHLPAVRPKMEDSLIRRINRLHEELNSHYVRSRPETQQVALMPNAAEIEVREHELAQSLRELSLRDPEYVSLQQTATVSVEELQASLGAQTTLVEYFLEGDEVLAFVITPAGIRVFRHLCPFGYVQYMHESLRFQLDKFALGPQYVDEHLPQMIESTKRHLRELYSNLMRPLEASLRTEHIVIVPHGRLHYLPFHAFLDGDEYLIDRYSISYAPSGSVLNYCLAKENVRDRVPLMMGVSDDTTPYVQEELQALAALYPGARKYENEHATRKVFFEEAAEADFIHIAGHAVFRQDNPMFSSFKLTDGWVTALDLYSTTCQTNLVTVSGCKSGVNEIAGADDLLGLMRGFLYAGARSLLLSLWAVNDRSTSFFMQTFYREWQRGCTRSRAMQLATQAVRSEFPHPFHWAPFVLVGKP